MDRKKTSSPDRTRRRGGLTNPKGDVHVARGGVVFRQGLELHRKVLQGLIRYVVKCFIFFPTGTRDVCMISSATVDCKIRHKQGLRGACMCIVLTCRSLSAASSAKV